MDIPPIVLTVIGIGEAICQLIWRPMILLRIVPDVPMIGFPRVRTGGHLFNSCISSEHEAVPFGEASGACNCAAACLSGGELCGTFILAQKVPHTFNSPKAKVVEEESYLLAVTRYIHLNPIKIAACV